MSDPIPVHEYSVSQQKWPVPRGWGGSVRLPIRYAVTIRSNAGNGVTLQLRNDEGQSTYAVIDCDDVDMFASALQAAAAQSRIVHMLNNPPEDEAVEGGETDG